MSIPLLNIDRTICEFDQSAKEAAAAAEIEKCIPVGSALSLLLHFFRLDFNSRFSFLPFQELPRLLPHEDPARPGIPRLSAVGLQPPLHDGLSDGAPLHEESTANQGGGTHVPQDSDQGAAALKVDDGATQEEEGYVQQQQQLCRSDDALYPPKIRLLSKKKAKRLKAAAASAATRRHIAIASAVSAA